MMHTKFLVAIAAFSLFVVNLNAAPLNRSRRGQQDLWPLNADLERKQSIRHNHAASSTSGRTTPQAISTRAQCHAKAIALLKNLEATVDELIVTLAADIQALCQEDQPHQRVSKKTAMEAAKKLIRDLVA